jgi:methionyl-tRNA formyltransferase
MSLHLIMMGTGPFAVPTFRALVESRHTVAALVTQPPRSGPGRHRHAENPMRSFAQSQGIPVLEPAQIKHPDSIAAVAALHPDLIVVAAYGQILPKRLLGVPRLGGINLHASLLPKYRGAAPVNWAIFHGETRTGVTVIEMLPELDAGPILGSTEVEILPRETALDLEERLARLGAPLVLEILDRLVAGTVDRRPQDPSLVTLAPKLQKSDGLVDWSRSAREIVDQIRAMQPWPSAFTFWFHGDEPPRRLILRDAEAVACESNEAPGTVLVAENSRLEIATGKGALRIERLQPAGKQVMTAPEFLRGQSIAPGDRFDAEPDAAPTDALPR